MIIETGPPQGAGYISSGILVTYDAYQLYSTEVEPNSSVSAEPESNSTPCEDR